ncbi:MAG: Do family serine endopeptidase [Candidatus Cloacimonetes bacterium]|nr:Do family serine endopeptidase [Candidatus Cloacimonadota bacterium]MDY0299262.1 Do family serine endopeptidase [Candidatus Cloacimonadaceae bacterium]MCB5278449.1 Do family serine endopeptidase [Candidatus Cloacimonadota bacterium]MCK9332934.1 Do family serine endopeptidase [Candidatus Cloacimonadota bacterium]MDD2210655.1 Do family serine endopeptidase [Candidatus Cloacimonadota bacterium]
MKFSKYLLLLLMVISLSSCAHARTSMVGADGQSPVVKVVRDVREAVVQIKVEAQVSTRQNTNPFFNDDPFFRFFFPSPQRQRQVTSMGSGFIFEYNEGTREAFIMTNNHVAERGRDGKITVTLADKKTYSASVVGLDSNTDVAVIKIKLDEDEEVTIAPLGDSSKLEIGEWAIAIGNPFAEGLERTVTLGVISALGRYDIINGENSPLYQDFIQTDAAINPGNSGGPLLNINGEVIGINTAITSTSGGNIGIGFAIPINLAKRVVEDLIASGRVQRAYIGILPQEITADLVEAFSLDEVSGVLIAKVEKDSPAEDAGLKAGDVILEISGEKVSNVARFRIAVATAKIGSKLPIDILRDKKLKTVYVTLEAFPEDSVAMGETDGVKTAISTGIGVESTDGALAKRMNLNTDKGVVVSSVDPNSPASQAGLQVGMVILMIDDTEVNSVSEFNSTLSAAKESMEADGRKTIRLYVTDRNQVPRFMVLRFE